MKKLELVFNVVSIFVDAVMIVLAGSVAYFLRYRVENFIPQYPIQFDLSYHEFLNNILIATPFLVVILALYGLYNLSSTRGFWKIFAKVAAAVSTSLMIFVAFYFFNQHIFPSRLIVLMSWVLVIILLGLGRLVLLMTERSFLKKGIGLHKLVLITEPRNNFDLESEIVIHPEYGYKVIAQLSENPQLMDQLEYIKKEQSIDEIIQASLKIKRELNEQLLKFTHDHGIKFNYVPDIFDVQRSNISVRDIAGIPIIELKSTPLEGWGKIVKRSTDVFFSLLSIIILSPVFLLVALAVKLDSRGKILFVQERFGQGKSFKFLKFRSMYQELSVGTEYGGVKAEEVRKALWKQNARHGPFLKIKNDPRVTRVGRVLRKTKLDELPQLFNVLSGSMSLVGPRAHVLEEVNLYKEKYKRQFTIKPGITGLTQITQARIPDLPFEEEIRLDTFYLENWSWFSDLKILFRTFFVLIKRPKSEDY